MRHAVVAALAVALVACAGGLYTPMPLKGEAALRAEGDLVIRTVNGKPVPRIEARAASLQPGPQSVVFVLSPCRDEAGECARQPTSLEAHFEARTGRVYTARVDEPVRGSQVFRVWIADDAGTIVAPQP